MAKTNRKPPRKSTKAIDRFTLEIIKEGLVAVGDEMFVTMQRTSMSTIIYEVLDYATGLTDAKGNLITQGNGVTLFLGTLDFGVRSVLDKFGAENLKPGDIYITNDPYGGRSPEAKSTGRRPQSGTGGRIIPHAPGAN